jgi:mannitol-1-phosphate/altronate dehydrogenase
MSVKYDATRKGDLPVMSTTTAIETPVLKTKHLAAKFNMKPTALRRVLRSMPEYADGVHTNYSWQGESDPRISRIAEAIKKQEEDRKARAAKAKEELAAKAKAEDQAKVTPPTQAPAPEAKGKGKK